MTYLNKTNKIPSEVMDLRSPKSPGWKNKFEMFTRKRPRDDQDEINIDGGDGSVVCVDLTHEQAQHNHNNSQYIIVV